MPAGATKVHKLNYKSTLEVFFSKDVQKNFVMVLFRKTSANYVIHLRKEMNSYSNQEKKRPDIIL